MLRAALLLFAAMGWKVKSTATSQSLLRDLWEIILPASFQTAGALWAKAITSAVRVPVKRRPLPGDICWAPFRGILIRYTQCFACGNGMTRCKLFIPAVKANGFVSTVIYLTRHNPHIALQRSDSMRSVSEDWKAEEAFEVGGVPVWAASDDAIYT